MPRPNRYQWQGCEWGPAYLVASIDMRLAPALDHPNLHEFMYLVVDGG